MAETAVKFVLDKLTPFFSNEVHMMNGGREEVVYVRTELERMKVFLRTADCLEETDEEVKLWVKQTRDVAHDIEDVLDEFTLLLTHNHGDGFYGFLHKLSCCVKNMKARYRIAYEIQGINSRIKSIDEGHLRLRKKFRAAEQAGSSLANSWNDRRGDALLLDETDLVGIDGPKDKVAELLVGGSLGRQVVSLAGMGGMGKTTLAKQVYDDRQVKKHFTIRAWITVSRSFKMKELLKDMLKQLFQAIRKSVPKAVETMSSDGLKKIMKDFLQERRYLIVLDDVWHMNDWDAVKYALPTNNCGSRVMLTTRKVDLAFTSRLESEGWVYNLQPLPLEESWILFCTKTFHGKACPPHLEEICRCILKKCEGLPLAIVAIGGVLAAKDRRRIDEWEIVYRSLGAEIEGNDKLQNLKKVLSLSLSDLPCHLKACFLYLSIFPGNHLIEPMRLVRLWTAEGFVEAKEGKTVEEVAQGYLSELLNRSLMQVAGTTSDGRVKACRIHDFLREIIKTKSREHNIAAIAKHMNQNALWPDKVRRLSVHNTLQNVQQNRFVNASQLRSLFMFGIDEKPRLHVLFPSGFKLLGVLDMRGTPVTKFPIEVINLYYLKYLSLRDTKVKTIPRYIGKLQNLETLDLKHAYVTELPSEILNLKKLRYLMVYRYEYGTYTLSGYGFKSLEKIGVLQSLQKLCFIEANHVGTLQELGKLTQLKRLGVIKLRKQDGKMLCSSIEHLTNLRALAIASTEESEIIDLQHLHHPPQLLQRIYLVGRLESFPHWITYVHSLAKLKLRWSRLKEDPLVFLQDLPNLVHLELLQAYNGDMLCFMAGGFKKLKQLGLEKFEGLRFVEIQKGAMPCIEKLRIQWCKSLQKVPLGIEHLSQLKMLEFFDLPHKLLKTIRRDGGGEDYWRVAHIPKVHSTYWRDGRWEAYVRFHQDEQLKPINVEGLVMSYKITREISLGL